MLLLSIDPGDKRSAYCIYDTESENPIIESDILENEDLLTFINNPDVYHWNEFYLACEMIASYGMPVGHTVFETCVWIGRFWQASYIWEHKKHFVYRKDVKLTLCGNPRAKDGNIRQALVDIFGDKGTKKNPGKLYGFHDDMYAALAVAVAFERTFKPPVTKIIRRAI
jgi:hypothetical protein